MHLMETCKRNLASLTGADCTIELNVPEVLMPSVLRALAWQPSVDWEVDRLPLPSRPVWLRLAVRGLRLYRTHVSPVLGQRCGFEPSCSRYAELALRGSGLIRGVGLTLRRLHRCRPGAGGIDLP
jgi:uncharacterized protein